jgi:hypothetical protein
VSDAWWSARVGGSAGQQERAEARAVHSRGHRETQTTARFAAASACAYPKGQVTAPSDRVRGPGEQRALGTSYCNAASTFREIGFVSQICRTDYAAFTVSRRAFFSSPPPRCSLGDTKWMVIIFPNRAANSPSAVGTPQPGEGPVPSITSAAALRQRKRQTWCCSGTRLSFIYDNLVRAA